MTALNRKVLDAYTDRIDLTNIDRFLNEQTTAIERGNKSLVIRQLKQLMKLPCLDLTQYMGRINQLNEAAANNSQHVQSTQVNQVVRSYSVCSESKVENDTVRQRRFSAFQNQSSVEVNRPPVPTSAPLSNTTFVSQTPNQGVRVNQGAHSRSVSCGSVVKDVAFRQVLQNQLSGGINRPPIPTSAPSSNILPVLQTPNQETLSLSDQKGVSKTTFDRRPQHERLRKEVNLVVHVRDAIFNQIYGGGNFDFALAVEQGVKIANSNPLQQEGAQDSHLKRISYRDIPYVIKLYVGAHPLEGRPNGNSSSNYMPLASKGTEPKITDGSLQSNLAVHFPDDNSPIFGALFNGNPERIYTICRYNQKFYIFDPKNLTYQDFNSAQEVVDFLGIHNGKWSFIRHWILQG